MDKEKLHQILSSLWKNDDSVGKTYYNQALQDVQTAIDLQEEPKLEGVEKEVAEGYVARINRKRIPIELKGEIKAKFKNEFHTIWQIVNRMQFANVAKYIIERICLHFATWGAYHLKDYIGMSDKEKAKMDSMQEEPVSEEWIEELRTKLDSMSKEDFKKVFDKYAVDFNEEPVSEDLEEASKEWLSPQLDKSYAAYGVTKQMELTHFDGYAMLDAIEFGAKWQKENMMKGAVNGLVYAQRTNGEVMFRSNYVKKEGFEFGDKVKVIVIKED